MATKKTSSAGRGGRGRGAGRGRRTPIRRTHVGPLEAVTSAVRSPSFAWGVVVWLGFTAVASLVVVWGREQPMVAVGRVMTHTRLVRVPLTTEDLRQTEDDRQAARQKTPRVFVVERAVLDTLAGSLRNLPMTLAGIETLGEVDEELKGRFGLTAESFAALRAKVVEGRVSAEWEEKVRRLIEAMEVRPVLSARDFQTAVQEGTSPSIELRVNGRTLRVLKSSAVSVADAQALADAMDTIVRRRAGMSGPEAQVAFHLLTNSAAPTFRYDASATKEQQEKAAAEVPVRIRENTPGEVIFQRGEVLSRAQLNLYEEEIREFLERGGVWKVGLMRLGGVLATGLVGLLAAGYAAVHAPRVRRKPARMWALAGLMAGLAALSTWGTAVDPDLVMLTAAGPTVLLTVILSIAYDRRLAMGLAILQAVLTLIAVQGTVGLLLVMLAGIGSALWQAGEIRDRAALVRLGVVSGVAMALGVGVAVLVSRPLVGPVLREALRDAGWALGGGLAVGAFTLFSLPGIERAFKVTTAMTLIELRDPRHELLRMLQQRAPGTYNHSLNVASIAEAAAQSIGANSLLTYVGALYHDIGKMNKPEYFVENQSGGPNRHDRLSPAMSVLVIIGHVKDGMELAREFGLPRIVQQFIEGHHGTTLVEFFYNRARARAEAEGESDEPEEVEFRYPGPRPQSKEVAIVMLADSVESATRSMAEPTPSRIDALVRTMAGKRLLDGQFDECDLTLKELNRIEASISKSVASIYHGRIAYPSGEGKKAPAERQSERRA